MYYMIWGFFSIRGSVLSLILPFLPPKVLDYTIEMLQHRRDLTMVTLMATFYNEDVIVHLKTKS